MIERHVLESPPKYIEDEKSLPFLAELKMHGILQPIQDEYLYWDKAKYKVLKYDGIKFWSAIKLDRRLQSKEIRFGKYTFTYPHTDYMQRALHQFDLNIGGHLGSNIGIADTDKAKYVISSIMEEAISSSQMEGAVTTRKKAKEMIQKELRPKNTSEQMIMNNYVTMKHIIQHKNDELTPESLLYIHKLMTVDTLEDPKQEGFFRSADDIHIVNYVDGEIVHTPPSHVEMLELMDALCTFFNKEHEHFMHPIIKACILHFMLAWIHPFADGNGRTARALFYWYLLKKGYWLTEYLSISRIIKDTKIQYEKAYLYVENDDHDLGYFISYHLRTMQKAFEALKAYINTKQQEVVQSARYLKIPEVNERMAQVIKIIYDDPVRVLNSREIENRFSISNFTARSDLKTLVKLGFLEIIQVNKIKQNFVKSPEFDQLIAKYNK